jgi:hypothetical protein
MEQMAQPMTDLELSSRYGDLYKAVCNLPCKPDVDVERVLKQYLGDYIHFFQSAVTNNPGSTIEEVKARLRSVQPATASVFSVTELNRPNDSEFSATITIPELLGRTPRRVRVTQNTNAGTGDFEIEEAVNNSH